MFFFRHNTFKKGTFGQYVLVLIYNHVRAIKSRNQNQQNITIGWIPAHVDVAGNKFADEEAKSAALLGAGMEVKTLRLYEGLSKPQRAT
jgi:ribonuclease HI